MTEYPIPTLKTWLESTMKPAKPHQRAPKVDHYRKKMKKARLPPAERPEPKPEPKEARPVPNQWPALVVSRGAVSSIWALAERCV